MTSQRADSAAPASPAARPRVLIIAELCNPDWVSVPLEGWSHARALARFADVHLVTHVRNAENLVKAGLGPGDFTALDPGGLERVLFKAAAVLRGGAGAGVGQTTQTAASSLVYYRFEQLLWDRFGEDLKAGRCDLVHRLTPTAPSIIARRCRVAGVPFILGPLNGGLPWPPGFSNVREREWLSFVRDGYKLLPGYRGTRDAAGAIICGSGDAVDQLGRKWKPKAVYIPENGIDPTRFDRSAAGPVQLPLRVAFVGRLVPYKGAHLLLEAAAPLIRSGQVEVDLIGDGPEMPALRALADKHGLGKGAVFAGWVKHQDLQERLCRAHVFGFPSVREFGGAVVLEAMALGLVPIVVGYGGPGELVTPQTGFRIPIGPPEELVRAFRRALEGIAADPAQVRAMGARARARVFQHFTWEAKAAQTLQVYEWALGRRDKPDFGFPLPDEGEAKVTHPALR